MVAIPMSMWIGVVLVAAVMAVLGVFVARPEWPRYQQAFVCAVALVIGAVVVAGYNDFGFVFHITEDGGVGPVEEDVSGISGWNNRVTRSGWTVITAQQRWQIRRSAAAATFTAGCAGALAGAGYATLRRHPRGGR